MEYTKPVIVAQNNSNGSFAAGCLAKDSCNGGTVGGVTGGSGLGNGSKCQKCERTR
jgi:hypothetical protein